MLTDSPLSIVKYTGQQQRRFLRLKFRPASLEKHAVLLVLNQLQANSNHPFLTFFPFHVEPTTFISLLTVMHQAISEQLIANFSRLCAPKNN